MEMDDEDQLIYEEDDWKFEDEEEETHQVSIDTAVRKEKDVECDGIDEELFLEFSNFNSTMHKAHVWDLNTKMGRLRFKTHLVMDHITLRIFAITLVFTDIALVIVALATLSDNIIYSRVTIAIVSYFMLELCLRLFAWGREFFHHRLEVVDMGIIIITFVMTLIFEIIAINAHLKFGKLLVIFRLSRIVMLARIWTGRRHIERSTRNLISQNKRRYVKDGFDLDLTYVTDNVIAMSFPSSGKTSIYRNPISEVVRFFNTKHPGRYKIYNLCSERSYDAAHFNGSVERVMIEDHNVPTLCQLLQCCQNIDEWMKKDKENIIAVHCKGGKGRTGSCIAAWLVYSGQFKTAEKALGYFGTRRTDQAKGRRYQGVETPSQSRYVGYLERIVHEMNGIIPHPKVLVLKSITITGLKHVGNGDGTDLTMKVHMENKCVYELVCACPIEVKIKQDGDAMKIKFNVETSPVICGDVKIRFISSNSNVPKDYDACSFFFWFHTSFLYNNKLHLTRNEIGNCHKKKHWQLYRERFSVTMKCSLAPNDVTHMDSVM